MKKLLFLVVLLLTLFGCSGLGRKRYTDEELISAVAVDNISILNKAIRNGLNVNEPLNNGETLLGLALKDNSLQVISLLLSNGVDINNDLPAKQIVGTSIILAPRPPLFYVNSNIAFNMLLKDKAKLDVFSGEGQLLLNYYIKTKPQDLTIELINNKANLNIKDSSNWYPIFWAVNIENVDIVKAMLKIDSKQYLLKDEKLNYPIYYANSREMLKELLKESYNPYEKNIYGENILGEVYLKAKKLGYSEITKVLIDKGVNPNYTSYK